MPSQAPSRRSVIGLCFSTAALILTFLPGDTLKAGDPQPAVRGRIVRASSYFPLRPGYKWVYGVKSQAGTATWEVTVLDEKDVLSGRPSFQLSGYFRSNETYAVRPTRFDTIVEVGSEGKEYLWYDFGARVGENWKMQLAPPGTPSCEDGVILAMASRNEVVSVPAGDFEKVVRIDRAGSVCADAGITSEWFAPGVGLIRREEQSIAGPVVSELLYAELGDDVFPPSRYTTSLSLSSPRYTNNLMPPVSDNGLPRVRGVFSVRTRSPRVPTELVFSGCKSLTVEIRNEAGEVVRKLIADDGGCCECDALPTANLAEEPVVLPFAFILADEEGKPLPDGFYSLTTVLNSQDSEALRPAARARIEVQSVY